MWGGPLHSDSFSHWKKSQASGTSGKQLDTHAIFSSLLNTTQGWNFPGTLEHRGIYPALQLTCYSSSAKPHPCSHLPKQGCHLLTKYFLSQHHYLPSDTPFEPLMTARGAHPKSPTSVPSLARSQPQPKFKMPLKARAQVCGWSGLSVVYHFKICPVLILSCLYWCKLASSFLTHHTQYLPAVWQLSYHCCPHNHWGNPNGGKGKATEEIVVTSN